MADLASAVLMIVFPCHCAFLALVEGNVSVAYIDRRELHCKVLTPLTFQFRVKPPC